MSNIRYLLLCLAISSILSDKDYIDPNKNSYLSPEDYQYQQIINANKKPAQIESYYDSDEFDTTGVDISTINANIKNNNPAKIKDETKTNVDFNKRGMNSKGGASRSMGMEGMESMSNMGGHMGGSMGGMGENMGGKQSNNFQNYNNNSSNKCFKKR